LRAAAPIDHETTRIYPRIRVLLPFLGPFAVWHLATGSFNPFNNVYFARLGFPVQQIGNLFSGSQLAQMVAMLLAPLVIRRAGLLARFGYGAVLTGAAGLAVVAAGLFRWLLR